MIRKIEIGIWSVISVTCFICAFWNAYHILTGIVAAVIAWMAWLEYKKEQESEQ